MKAVFDTNVLVSALITSGKPKQLFLKVLDAQLVLLTSKPILREFKETVRQPKIRKYANKQAVAAFLNAVLEYAVLVKVTSQVEVVLLDPDDGVILRTALDGCADFVVSGDRHLLSLGSYEGIKILTVEQALFLLAK